MPIRRNDPSLAAMRAQGVLQDVDAHRIDAGQGVVLVTCGDGDQVSDILEHVQLVCLEHCQTPRTHLLCQNGGALNLPRDSPLRRWFMLDGVVSAQPPTRDLVLLDDIFAACEMKGIETVILLAHAPCGAARAARLSLEDTVRLLISAKRRIKDLAKSMDKTLRVACFYHVCWESAEGSPSRRTYFVSTEAWRAWTDGRVRLDRVEPFSSC